MEKLYRVIIFVQDGPLLYECCEIYDGSGFGTPFSDGNGEDVIDFLKQWDCDECGILDFDEGKPYIVNNGTDVEYSKDSYTLLYNSTIGGVYMLYREADQQEIDWFYQNK